MNATVKIGRMLEAARVTAGVTKAELARRLNSNPSYIGHVEMGRKNITIATLVKFTEALGCDLDVIVTPRIDMSRH